ncbi:MULTISPECIES: fatty acid--CoA ligase [Pseudomonas syringae group]|uniref:Fatty acid--CoA ligase n=3 Tax=Pseudomonas syringae group TaxID=136849 RepID=A0AAW4DU94_PSESX|nr:MULTISPECIES: fatty acid--CoA ligase [Pseudomonas syringae group]AVI83381.1 long-chain fatty acid--CoA ligase [Pseudomonas syringae pv. tomato]EEB61574.1 medium-chain-fatty-acid--CoA ligase [Pseudomonas syringae pv. tomato T1]KGK96703.1 long-chain fatty acid--CoA ligase [Pseudomonas syringae pv. tomato]KPW59603.1 Long-chain-fatty-acid--CoA ligase [Pseudomonas syringae pv. berberidis]KPY28754.1 Medium-chain-fatty-acid--CoA ligase [Pseudomonas syringae pv. philadelphi]
MLQTRVLPPADGAYQYPLLIKSLLLSGSRYEKTREIIYRDSVRYSYPTLKERICRLANVLTAAGVKAGDTVAVMDWDSHRYLECMFAIPMIGAVIHTVNVRLSPEQIAYTINHADDRLVLVNSDFTGLYQAMAGHLTTVEKTLLLTDLPDKTADLPNLVGEYETLLAAASPEYEFEDFDENSVATMFYTTGTTGNPKGVYFTHRQLVLHTLGLSAIMGCIDSTRLLGTNDVYMPITPMFHVHAWGIPYAATMLGLKQVYPGRYEPELLVELWRREKVTFSHCVPTILQMLLNAKSAQDVDFGGWKIVIGGSALNRSLYQTAKAKGIQLTAAYGMSETGPLISVAHINEELKAGSEDEQITYRIKAGVPGMLVDAAIIDQQGNFLPADGETQGELVLRAPWLTESYYREPEKGAELWAGGWLRTGDVATLDDMGFIDIRDRIKDVIKTGGEWISSLELEDLCSRHPAVREVAVVGIADPQWGERPFALLVIREGHPFDAKELKEHLKPFVEQGHINKWAIPSQIALVTEIPKTSVGKLDKKRMRLDIVEWQNSNSTFLSTL